MGGKCKIKAAILGAIVSVACVLPAIAAQSFTYRKVPIQPVAIQEEFWMEAAEGAIRGVYTVHEFGKNTAIGAGTTEDIWAAGGTIVFSTQPVRVRVRSNGNAADDPAGSGAGTLTVRGLDQDWNLYEEDIYTSGTAAGPLSNGHFMRVHSVFVSTLGTAASYNPPGSNVGAITVETSSGAVMAVLAAGIGRAQNSQYTVPAGYTCHLFNTVICDVAANKPASCQMWQRNNAWDTSGSLSGAKRLVWSAEEAAGEIQDSFQGNPYFPQMTDIWFSASAGAGAESSVSVNYDLVCDDEAGH